MRVLGITPWWARVWAPQRLTGSRPRGRPTQRTSPQQHSPTLFPEDQPVHPGTKILQTDNSAVTTETRLPHCPWMHDSVSVLRCQGGRGLGRVPELPTDLQNTDKASGSAWTKEPPCRPSAPTTSVVGLDPSDPAMFCLDRSSLRLAPITQNPKQKMAGSPGALDMPLTHPRPQWPPVGWTQAAGASGVQSERGAGVHLGTGPHQSAPPSAAAPTLPGRASVARTYRGVVTSDGPGLKTTG